jgi:hypothetical protein
MAAFFMRPQIMGLPILFRLLPPGNASIATAAPLLRQEKVGAYNWDFASGKSQTIYPWDGGRKPVPEEPRGYGFTMPFAATETPVMQAKSP